MNDMKRAETLLSWIGVTDYEHFVGKKSASPLVAVAKSVRPRSIKLLWGDGDKTPIGKANEYQGWLKRELRSDVPAVQVEIHGIPESSGKVMEFGWVFVNLERYLARLSPSEVVCINASSGTSMMTAAWIVWAKTFHHPDAHLYVSSPEKGVQPLELPPELHIDLHRVLAIRDEDPLLERLLTGWSPPKVLEELQGSSKVMRAVLLRIEQAARFMLPVLIQGEPGTGKSVLARLIHKLRKGSDDGFVPVDCGQLFGATEIHGVFGWATGAFTGAIRENPGLIVSAEEGTLFLDEIGNAPIEIQANLLRILQEKKYRRLGDTKEKESTARIVAATNTPLYECVREGKFRRDLFDRLDGIVIEIPPLRGRDSDVIELAHKKLELFQNDKSNRAVMTDRGISEKRFSSEAESALRRYDWPGNVRELEHVIARLVIFGDPSAREITAEEVRRQLADRSSRAGRDLMNHDVGGPFKLDDIVLEIQEHYVKVAAKQAQGNKTEIARLLGFGHLAKCDGTPLVGASLRPKMVKQSISRRHALRLFFEPSPTVLGPSYESTRRSSPPDRIDH
jgi:DNA-binding NtrC family response regulator